MEEQLILQQIRSGDEMAFEKLFHLFYERLARYAWSILEDQEAAEEIVQEVFVKFWEQRSGLEIQTAIRPYLYKSVHNRCLNVIRHLKVRKEHQENTHNTAPEKNYDGNELLVAKELKIRIETAMDKLPPECKKVFRLSRFEELSYREIAEHLEISIKTVENQMGKALRIMRTELSDYLFWIILLLPNGFWMNFLFST